MPERPHKQKDAAPPSEKAPSARKWKADRALGLLAFIAGLVGSLGSILTIPLSWDVKFGADNRVEIAERYEIRDEKFELIRVKLRELDDKIAALSAPPDESRNALQVKELAGNVAKLQESVSDMQRLIMDNPSKALAVPLMRKDLDGFKENSQAEMAAIRKDVDRIYDLNKWLVGLMFTMALGVLTLAISNFWKAKEKAAETGQDELKRDAPAK